MQTAKHLLGWRFERRLFQEIARATSLSDRLKTRQTAKLRRVLKRQPGKRSTLIPNSHVPEAFSFVPLSDTAAVYTKSASNGRPYQVWLYDHAHSSHTVLYEEMLSSCTVDVALTRDGQFLTINSNSRTSSEVSIVQSHDILYESRDLSPVLLRQREECVEYYVEHAHNRFYILTNLGPDREYKLMTASSDSPHTWEQYYQPEPGTVLQDMEVYGMGVVLYALRGGAPLIIALLPGEDNPLVLCGSEYTQTERIEGSEFNSKCWPVWFSSPVTPPTLHTLTPTREVMTYSSHSSDGQYCVERRTAVSKDGAEVPMTLCYHGDLLREDHENPVLVHVYGCYGECVPTGYLAENVPLLNRGWVLAYAHTRGGGERGRGWYYQGMGKNKHKTFEDLYACVKLLHDSLSCPELTALRGRSAGGLSVGMFCNMWPHLLQVAILEVPLVNLSYSLSDSTHYLSCKDYQEFGGDPRSSSAKGRDRVFSICPYSHLQVQDYPAMHISAARDDELIPFAGICHYVTTLRDCVAQYHGSTRSCDVERGTVVFEVDQAGGHYGNTDWRERAKKVSKQVLFLHRAMKLNWTVL